MAFQRRYVDEYGATHTAAYIMVEHIDLIPNEVVNIRIKVFHNADARSKSDVSLQKTALLTHSYSVTGTDFNTFFADTVLDDEDKNIVKQSYAYLKTQGSPIDFASSTTDV